jgi:hypothetical protein
MQRRQSRSGYSTVTSYQDTRPQKRRYSSEALDSTDPSTERRYPSRKRQLTVKAAALIIDPTVLGVQ